MLVALFFSQTFAEESSHMSKKKKLSVPDISVQASIEDFEARKKILLEMVAQKDITAKKLVDPTCDLYSNRAIANLLLGRFPEEANQRIRRTAEWFDHPHPNKRSHDGECDFAAMKLCRAYYLFSDTDLLEKKTHEAIRRFFLNFDFESLYGSENHALLFRTSRYLMAQAMPESTFKAYKKKGRELLKTDLAWLKHYIRFRARRGWGEFDSLCYFMPEWECLINLYDYSKDQELMKLAGMMLDLLLADMAVDSLNGMYGGAHGRIYARHALDHAKANTYPLQYLYFGNVDQESLMSPYRLVEGTLTDALVSSYKPAEIVLAIALDRTTPYENRERKHLHNPLDIKPRHPVKGSIRKYTYWTPDYVLGCVQRQDPYPQTCRGKWYAHHEQHQWELTIGTRTTSRIFTHHPGKRGNEHGYWTGDIHCGCGHFFQHKNALIALYDIPGDEPYKLIHAYLPRDSFEEMMEKDGWIFILEGGVYIGLKLINGYAWTVKGEWKGKEVISRGRRNGVVCEVGLASEFESFDDFQKNILGNTIKFSKKDMNLMYSSKRNGRLSMDTSGMRKLNGNNVDLGYPTYGCPYIKSEWDSGIIHLIHGKKRLTLDFLKGLQD